MHVLNQIVLRCSVSNMSGVTRYSHVDADYGIDDDDEDVDDDHEYDNDEVCHVHMLSVAVPTTRRNRCTNTKLK